MLSGRRKKEVRKKTPEQMGKVLYWIAAQRAAEARKQYGDESRFPGTAVTVYSILYNLAFLRLALFRKYSASVVNEVHCLAIDELDWQYGARIRELTPESALELARRVTFSVASCLDDIAQGDQSALYRLAKEYLRDISGCGSDEILGADLLINACALLAGWIDSYSINEVYEIVSDDPPAPEAGGAPASTPAPVVPAAPSSLVPGTAPEKDVVRAAAPPPRKGSRRRPVFKYAACLLVLALVFCGGYGLGSSREEGGGDTQRESHSISSASGPWVYISRTGTKYHRTSSCSNMNDPIFTTLDEALSLGYTRCSKCW